MRQKVRKSILTFSALIFPFTFLLLSPYLIILAATQGILNGSAMVFGAMLVFSIVASRLFCGWLCPGSAVQDHVSAVNGRRWNGKGKNIAKYLIWAVWLGFVVSLWVKNWPLSADPLFNLDYNIHHLVIYIGVVTIIYLFALITGKHGMCHSFCWMAPFMIIGENLTDLLHIPRFRLKAYPDKCNSCGKCSRNCPMSLDVAEMIKEGKPDSVECINCLVCVDGCPQKAIGCGIHQKQR